MKKIFFYVGASLFLIAISINASNPQLSAKTQVKDTTIVSVDTIKQTHEMSMKKMDKHLKQGELNNKKLDSLILLEKTKEK